MLLTGPVNQIRQIGRITDIAFRLVLLTSLVSLPGQPVWAGFDDPIVPGRPSSPPKPENWPLLDPDLDKIMGTGTERVHREFPLTPPQEPVIVAVIDSGMDIHHKDLAPMIWTNPNPGRPGDPYIGDLHGWNFLGGKNGPGVRSAPLEITREYGRLLRKKNSIGLSPDEIPYYETLLRKYTDLRAPVLKEVSELEHSLRELSESLKLLHERAGLVDETTEALRAIQSTDPEILRARDTALGYFEQNLSPAKLRKSLKWARGPLETLYNIDFDYSKIVGDDPNRLDDTGYGNNNVDSGPIGHGTTVAGVIAALRDNGIGINGQTNFVRIMALAAVPEGDERDKDVGNAIRYAADHGARIINMSFSKSLSPDRDYVRQCIRYAAAKDVLFVHAAGNESLNNDETPVFPEAPVKWNAEDTVAWIEVGASTPWADDHLRAGFSNWGKRTMDLFAPGDKVNTTVPLDHYGAFSGTSLAAPQVAGMAALLRSQHPGLSAHQIRSLILRSVRKFPELPWFAELSRSGGIANLMNAMKALSELR